MSRAVILYERADAEKSRVLIGKYSAALKARGVNAGLVITDRLPQKEVLDMARGAELVINRTRDAGLAKFLEDNGLFVSNPSPVTETANDKLLTYERLSPLVPMLPTLLLEDTAPPLPFPFVAKPAAGHGGAGVTLIKNAEELAAYRAAHPEKSVVQPLASEPGRDMRIYVTGGRPLAAMLRESREGFRSNFSLGGKASFVPVNELPGDVLGIVSAVCSALPLHYAGVDVMRDRGRAVLNEIEDPVGARMLYIFTGLDPAKAHAEFLLSQL
ncbi:MAG: ATP-grasp domain-containing protein [Clostridia bacterium]|nr:ATP-grasp domain-containing protein [Clostridia bacterium]